MHSGECPGAQRHAPARRPGAVVCTVNRFLTDLQPERAVLGVLSLGVGTMASNSPRDHSISQGAARQIAGAFKLAAAEVVIDAGELSTWCGSGDDLMQWLER